MYTMGDITKRFDNGSDYDILGKMLYIYGSVALIQFNIRLNVNHVAAGTYYEFYVNTSALEHVIDHDFRTIRVGEDCQVYTLFQNVSDYNFDVMMYFFNDYNNSTSGDIIYLKFMCFCGDFINL